MLSGLIGAGAQDGLEELLVRQLKEQMAQEEIRQAKAREAQAADRFRFDKESQAADVAHRNRVFDRDEQRYQDETQQHTMDALRGQNEKMDARMTRLTKESELDDLVKTLEGMDLDPARRTAAVAAARAGRDINPDDIKTRAQRKEEADEAERREIRIRRASITPPREGPAGKVIKEVGPDGKLRERWASPEELIKGVPIADTAPTKPVTGMERNVLGFYIRAKDAEETVAPLEDEIAKMPVTSQAWMEYAPNFLQSQTGQSYRQAQRAFTEARLRKESGAAVPQSEYDNDARTYFAQPGDTAQTIAQKRQKRGVVLRSLATASGRAYDEHFGTPMDGGEAGNVMTKEQVNQKTGARRTLVSTDGGKTWQVKQ